MHILVVEDDPHVANTIRLGLREAQYEVDVAPDGEQALRLAHERDYDFIVLDLLLPGCDGLEVVRTLRAKDNTVPVLILTAKEEIHDRVSGLDAGADDYLTKPFGLEELQARIRAVLRRRGNMVQTVLRAADLELDTLRHRVTRGGRVLDLTDREFRVLEYMMRRQDEIVTRAALAENVWGYNIDSASNFIDVHIGHLRAKIDEGFTPKLLCTVRGKGYLLRAADMGARGCAAPQVTAVAPPAAAGMRSGATPA